MTTIHTRQLQQYTRTNQQQLHIRQLKLATFHARQIRIQHVQKVKTRKQGDQTTKSFTSRLPNKDQGFSSHRKCCRTVLLCFTFSLIKDALSNAISMSIVSTVRTVVSNTLRRMWNEKFKFYPESSMTGLRKINKTSFSLMFQLNANVGLRNTSFSVSLFSFI